MERELMIGWILAIITYALLPDVGLGKVQIVLALIVFTMLYVTLVWQVIDLWENFRKGKRE